MMNWYSHSPTQQDDTNTLRYVIEACQTWHMMGSFAEKIIVLFAQSTVLFLWTLPSHYYIFKMTLLCNAPIDFISLCAGRWGRKHQADIKC
jgi:hypothetical protein